MILRMRTTILHMSTQVSAWAVAKIFVEPSARPGLGMVQIEFEAMELSLISIVYNFQFCS
jgi:hypothetical protein